jgi:hypothetical protein
MDKMTEKITQQPKNTVNAPKVSKKQDAMYTHSEWSATCCSGPFSSDLNQGWIS